MQFTTASNDIQIVSFLHFPFYNLASLEASSVVRPMLNNGEVSLSFSQSLNHSILSGTESAGAPLTKQGPAANDAS